MYRLRHVGELKLGKGGIMNADYILVRFGEIALKGRNRSRFEDKLIQNIRKVLKGLNQVKVTKTYGRIYVELSGESADIVMERLKKVFGLISFSPVKRTELDINEMKDTALSLIQQMNPKPKTFKVESKRSLKTFPLRSPEICNEIGGHILTNTEGITVDVHHPDTTVNVEVRDEGAFIFSQVVPGIGGMPGESSGRGIALLSGGIDSPVASWLAMKRGLLLEGVHFHTYPMTSADSIQKVIELAKVLSTYSGHFKLHIIPFLEIQKEIKKNNEKVSHNITIMRRIFMRIAKEIADRRKALTIVTGESLGQVASQTLESMVAINHGIDIPVIRPLITMDKLEIIAIAKKIGTFEPSILPYEDMCSRFVPKKPATKPSISIAERAEKKMDMEKLIESALANSKTITVTPYSKISIDDIIGIDE